MEATLHNGNMTARPYQSDNQTLAWDAENRPVTISQASGNVTFVYDGNGNRVKKTGGGVTTIYVNRYYEKNLTSGNVTSSYYLGGRLIAQREGTVLRYIHQDHLAGTAVMSSDNGTLISSIKFYPFGGARSGSVPTDKKFTGQRLDSTGLYFYNARYYDPGIGRFISPDSIVPNPMNPQSFNRYSYVLNNPLRYIDPSGHGEGEDEEGGLPDPWRDGLIRDYALDTYLKRGRIGTWANGLTNVWKAFWTTLSSPYSWRVVLLCGA